MTDPIDTPANTAVRQDAPTPADDAVAGRESLEAQFKAGLSQAPYYSVGRHWDDYAPAYRFGRDSRLRHAGRRFDEVETRLAQEWKGARAQSRLGWVEARGAVEDAWHRSDSEDGDTSDPGAVGLQRPDCD